MASYNCGEFRVLQAVMKGDSRDFWTLIDKKLLPKETSNYIPKLIAGFIVHIVLFGGRVCQQSVVIAFGANSAPLLIIRFVFVLL